MFGHAKRVFDKCIGDKMAVDMTKKITIKKNLNMLLDWENMLTLPCSMPMLHFVQSLVKASMFHC